MGKLEYNSSHPPIEVDDATLAHLKIVIGTKLRRQKSFMMTWPSENTRPGRLTVWMHPSIPLIFEFDSAIPVPIDPKRVESMMGKLNARGDLVLDQLD
ncbi:MULTISPECIES: hypothetical protein [unclassified Microbacterium]|uniref:DUF7882 family protein n=1 Tax=unclassified Microbacterium TaxID=2609290 RepID=UPI0021A3DF9E|nr:MULTISPECIES: hypothetical protein [unclassified Microbacterium]MCT1364084.1 hypothetical protein [Microbacterium sp. p3-SID131]MCT1375274.1 hypothetical protein [Microbacterium sp. p3-SID337]